MTNIFDQEPTPVVAREMQKLSALSPDQLQDLHEMKDTIEATAEATAVEAVAMQAATTETTKRTLGSIVVLSLTTLVSATLGLLAFTVFRGDQAMLDAVIQSVQPGTIVVAGISAVAGIAAGAGLNNNSKQS